MAYDEPFYERYERYLTEPRVRISHNRALRLFNQMSGCPRVLDLGCGRSQEFRRFGDWESYVGYDVEAEEPESPLDPRRGDYREPKFLDALEGRAHTAFVSLFSTEITAPPEKNMSLYRELFHRLEGLRWGLVSGFYYTSSRTLNPVEETGGIVSWQTLHALEDQWTHEYDEFRFVMHVPSEMFGEDVVEVWRIFQRRGGTR